MLLDVKNHNKYIHKINMCKHSKKWTLFVLLTNMYEDYKLDRQSGLVSV